MKQGRLTKLTPEVQRVIVDKVARGTPLKYAAGCAGINERTVHYWMRKGREGQSIFASFYSAVKRAECEAIALNVEVIQDASTKQWQAAAWILERRYPEQFGQNRREMAEMKKELAQIQLLVAELEKVKSANASNGPPTPG